MDKRDLTVIENTEQIKIEKLKKTVSRQTNPIAKKYVQFHNEKEKFSVRDIFNR